MFNPTNAAQGGALFGPGGQAFGFDGIGGSGGVFGNTDLWGGGTNQSQSTNSSSGQSSTDVWGAQSPHLQNLYGSASNLLGNQSPFTNMAMNMRAMRGMSGSPLNFGAQQGVMDTMSGAYMPGGEKYNDMTSSIMNSVMPAIDSKFASGGRFGSGLHKQGLGTAVADKLIQNSNFERGNMMNAFGMAPQLANQDYMDINQIAQAGQVPWQQLQNYQSLLGAPVMTSQATNQSQGQSTGQQQNTGGVVPGMSGMMQGLF